MCAGTLELKTTQADAHSDYIRSVGFSRDGTTIVSGSFDRSIKLWDAGSLGARIAPSPPWPKGERG